MYFEKFPAILYTLDDYKTAQIITDFLRRITISQELKENYVVYDEIDVVDGDTPESIAHMIYGDANYHWIVLLVNEILDPRNDWPLRVNDLLLRVEDKYGNANWVHHYEDNNGYIVTGNVRLNSSAQFGNLIVGDVVVTNAGAQGRVTSKASSSIITVEFNTQGATSGEVLYKYNQSNVNANITATTTIGCTAVTNFVYEDRENESKRRIRILKPAYVAQLEAEFESKIKQ